MTKNSALKKQARAYQQAHPGTRLADAMRAVAHPQPDRAGWAPGDSPAVRRNDAPTTCYFCGNHTAIRSYTDMEEDTGRVAVYCESSDCDAREVEIIVIDDGTTATRNRTDVRIMAHIEPMHSRPEWADIGPGYDWAAGTSPYVRHTRATVGCLFCGEQTCAVSRNDIETDNDRMRLHCTNSRCRVRELEVLIFRDGTGWPGERPDVKALRTLFPTRAQRLAANLPPGNRRSSRSVTSMSPQKASTRWPCGFQGRSHGSRRRPTGNRPRRGTVATTNAAGPVWRRVLSLAAENVQRDWPLLEQMPPPQGGGISLFKVWHMPQRITALLPPARLQPYWDFWTTAGASASPSDAAIASLYVWQVAMSSAWYEVLAYVEMVVRHALDTELRKWNAAQAGHGPDWLTNPAAPLRSILGSRTRTDVQDSAARAARSRNTADPDFGPHPRQGVPVGHDDLVAQMTFGNLVHVLPNDPPSPQTRQRFASGYSKHEQLWINATGKAFPNLPAVAQNRQWARFPTTHPVPSAVEQGYALSAALERLRRVRNRVGHHEQMFRVRHTHRHRDALFIVRAVSAPGAEVLRGLSRVPAQEATQPRP